MGSGYENSCRKCLLSLEHFVSSRKKTTTKKAECGVFFLSGNTCVSQTGGGTGRDISYPCPGSGGTTSRCACAQSLCSQSGSPAVPWSSLVEGGNLENGVAQGICPATMCSGTATCWSFPMLQRSGCVQDAARRCQRCSWGAPRASVVVLTPCSFYLPLQGDDGEQMLTVVTKASVGWGWHLPKNPGGGAAVSPFPGSAEHLERREMRPPCPASILLRSTKNKLEKKIGHCINLGAGL